MPTYNLSWSFTIKGNRNRLSPTRTKIEKVALYRAYFLLSLFLTCRLESSLVRTERGISLDMLTRTDVGFGLGERAGNWRFVPPNVRATLSLLYPMPREQYPRSQPSTEVRGG